MALSFSLGIRQVWEELSIMQAPGLYWVHCDRKIDADLFCRQVIRALPQEARAACIGVGEKTSKLLTDIFPIALRKLPLLTLPAKKLALIQLTEDLVRVFTTHERLFILLVNSEVWHSFSTAEIQTWVQEVSCWLNKEQSTLLIISHSNGINKIKDQLISQHRFLQGFVHLHWLQENAQYIVTWWSTDSSVVANQQLMLQPDKQGWFLQPTTQPVTPLSLNDETQYLAERHILEGAPPLSEHWQLFDSNEALLQQAENAHAATVILSLSKNDKIDVIANQIHYLRVNRGSALKIVVREMGNSLRYSDERLLLACGANLIAPHIASLSQFLTMLEGIQGQRFARLVPPNIDALLESMRPLQLKGYVSAEEFGQTVKLQMSNNMLPENGKGVLVALRPVPGLHAKQALTLCEMQRFGDIVTIINQRLFLFLSTCRVHDLQTALGFIFRLPVSEVFSNQEVWYQDREILAEIKQLHLQKTEALINDSPQQHSTKEKTQQTSPKIKEAVRRLPTEINLYEFK